jgi:cell division septation protein DedD
MSPEGPIARAEGRWRVLVGKFESPAHAGELERNVRAAGFPAEVTGGRDRSPYVVIVGGMAGEAAARAAMARLRAIPGSGILSVAEAGQASP